MGMDVVEQIRIAPQSLQDDADLLFGRVLLKIDKDFPLN